MQSRETPDVAAGNDAPSQELREPEILTYGGEDLAVVTVFTQCCPSGP